MLSFRVRQKVVPLLYFLIESSLRGEKRCRDKATITDSEMGGYAVIYEQEFPKYHRMSVGAIANRLIA